MRGCRLPIATWSQEPGDDLVTILPNRRSGERAGAAVRYLPAMLHSPYTPDQLARYAGVAIDRCFDMRPGELLLVNYEPEHRPLAVALAEAAYRRGLSVDSLVTDLLLQRAEVDNASDEMLGRMTPWRRARFVARTEPGTALISVDGQSDPEALANSDPERIALRYRRLAQEMPELFERLEA